VRQRSDEPVGADQSVSDGKSFKGSLTGLSAKSAQRLFSLSEDENWDGEDDDWTDDEWGDEEGWGEEEEW
jgi:hypothetical protein